MKDLLEAMKAVADAWNEGEDRYRVTVLGQKPLLSPTMRLEKCRAAHREPGTAERIDNDGSLTL